MAKKKQQKQKPKAKKETGGRKGSIQCFEQPITKVLRWMGEAGFNYEEAIAALKDQKLAKMPKAATVRTSLTRGEPAKLSAEQQKQLREAAKTVKEEGETK